jgi:hypothetical protein
LRLLKAFDIETAAGLGWDDLKNGKLQPLSRVGASKSC